MTFLRILGGCAIVGAVLFPAERACSQDRPPTVFFDDFTGSANPNVGWYANPEGSGPRSDGSLVLTASPGAGFAESGPSAIVLDIPIQSIVTQARYQGAADGGLGLFLPGGGFGSFSCGIGQGAWDGLFCNRDDRGMDLPSVLLPQLVPTDLDITQDTMLRLDVSNILVGDIEGTRLEFWAWQGESQCRSVRRLRLTIPIGWCLRRDFPVSTWGHRRRERPPQRSASSTLQRFRNQRRLCYS